MNPWEFKIKKIIVTNPVLVTTPCSAYTRLNTNMEGKQMTAAEQ
jgi:hypothetical protein